ncbi:DUF6705 family protein [Cloacibacterium sp.]|uniref:DUF6705 family protein n=1 Tax=Cloacibacterium sp. TaxID=1913682 RepID=UPI0039E28275
MKNIFYLLLMLVSSIFCKAQTYPLRTYTQLPTGAYLKDTNNELPSYEGTWKGTWDGKIIYLSFKKIVNYYKSTYGYYADILIAKFKVTDLNGNVLFNNTSLTDQNAKIIGGKFKKLNQKYSLGYVDNDICGLNGFIEINFTDSTKTKLAWKFNEGSNLITKDCPYYNSAVFPQPLPVNIILTKQ